MSSYSFCGAEFGDVVLNLIDDAIESGAVRYFCCAPEVCPTTGREHLQFMIYFKHAKTISAAMKFVKRELGFTSPMKPCDGTPAQNRAYCGAEDYEKNGKTKKKNPEFEEWGTLPQQGKRGDLDEVKKLILSGKTVDELAVERPEMVHQYGRTLDRLEDIRLCGVKRTKMTKGLWLYGKTGCGKSHKAFEMAGDDVYVWSNDRGWWDGYKGQKTVVINDFRGQIPFNELLQMVDKWPYSVRRRNRAPMPFTSELVIVTSPMEPGRVYINLDTEDAIEQLERRFEKLNLSGQGNLGPDHSSA